MENNDWMCEYCDGKLVHKQVTITHRWKDRLGVIENVPVSECQLCGERYFEVMKEIERTVRSRSEPIRTCQVPVRSYPARV